MITDHYLFITAQETIKASSLTCHTIIKKQSATTRHAVTGCFTLNTTHTSQTAALEQILVTSKSKDIKHQELPSVQAAIFPST